MDLECRDEPATTTETGGRGGAGGNVDYVPTVNYNYTPALKTQSASAGCGARQR
jgi:hypothetical protein